MAEIEAEKAKPENARRTLIVVREEGDEFVAEWEGVEYRQGNPFGLDSQLGDAGAPSPWSLYLLTNETPHYTDKEEEDDE